MTFFRIECKFETLTTQLIFRATISSLNIFCYLITYLTLDWKELLSRFLIVWHHRNSILSLTLSLSHSLSLSITHTHTHTMHPLLPFVVGCCSKQVFKFLDQLFKSKYQIQSAFFHPQKSFWAEVSCDLDSVRNGGYLLTGNWQK